MLDFSPQSSSTGKLSLPQPTIPQKPPIDRKPKQWKRAVIASSCVALGIAAAAVGAATLSYRLTHLTVETGVINGRTLPLRVPINGKIKAFYAQPGAPIKAGQVLARIEPGAQETQNLLQIQSDVNTTETQLTNAVNSLALLQRQFQEVQGTDDSLKDAKVAIAQKSLQHEQAAIEAATAKASAARSDFDRYRQLHAAGAISQQKVDQTRSLWQAAEAEVRQAKANFSSAQVSLGAFENRVPIALGSTLMQPRMNLAQTIQTQATLVEMLKTQLNAKKQQLTQARTTYSKRQDVEVQAPFTGVVYRTEREQGEQVNRPDKLLTLLDCNSLWIEAVIPADQASRIDVQKPVRVQLSGSQTFAGQVDLIQAVSSVEALKQQVQAIVPPVASSWTGQPLSRVTIKIPPPTQQTQTQQFCGVGQPAKLTFGVNL